MIHLARAQLGLDDATYRDVLWVVGKVKSSADLDAHGRARLIEHFKSRGFRVKAGSRSRHPGTVKRERAPLMGKIGAQLADMQLPWAYADGIAQRMHKVESVRFCDGQQLHSIVAALAYEQRRRQEALDAQ